MSSKLEIPSNPCRDYSNSVFFQLNYERTQYNKCCRNKKGQGLIEYALLISIIAIAVIASLSFFGESIENYIYSIGDSVSDAKASVVDNSADNNSDHSKGKKKKDRANHGDSKNF